jgi:hypothetical protein
VVGVIAECIACCDLFETSDRKVSGSADDHVHVLGTQVVRSSLTRNGKLRPNASRAFLALLHTITTDEIFVQIQACFPSDLSFSIRGV